MKAPANRGGNVPRGVLQEATQKRKPPIKTKGTRFDALVARYYPAVYSFASRLTDDPRQAIALTRDAFNSTRNQLGTCRDENVFASILMSTVIRAGLNAA
jgi:DNA-directed RNA polymerase specialized sigma24 family protein